MNIEHFQILATSARENNNCSAWNAWRQAHPDVSPNLMNGAFNGLSLGGADFSGANLMGASFRVADLIGTNFKKALLRFASFRYANLIGADFTGADLTGADFFRAPLVQANLFFASLKFSNFYGANLVGSSLIGADLEQPDLRSADLRTANLSDANLKNARLSYTNMDKTILKGTDLTGAFLQEVEKITVSQISQVKSLRNIQGISELLWREILEKHPELLKWWNPKDDIKEKSSEINEEEASDALVAFLKESGVKLEEDPKVKFPITSSSPYEKFTIGRGLESSGEYEEKELEAMKLGHWPFYKGDFLERDEYLYYLKEKKFIFYVIEYDYRFHIKGLQNLLAQGKKTRGEYVGNNHFYCEYDHYEELVEGESFSSEIQTELHGKWPQICHLLPEGEI